jgi:hypothetical protein
MIRTTIAETTEIFLSCEFSRRRVLPITPGDKTMIHKQSCSMQFDLKPNFAACPHDKST